jgi:hypothetical protein
MAVIIASVNRLQEQGSKNKFALQYKEKRRKKWGE